MKESKEMDEFPIENNLERSLGKQNDNQFVCKEESQSDQNYFDELFRHNSAGIAVYRASEIEEDFILVDLNPAGEKLSEVKRENVIGKKVTDAFPGIVGSDLFTKFQKVYKTGKPEQDRNFFYRHNNTEKWYHNNIFKLPDGKIVAVYEDVTDRILADNKLAESEERYRHMIENQGEGIGIVDSHECFTFINKAACEIFEYSENDLIGKCIFDFVDARAKSILLSQTSTRKKGETSTYELPITTGTGLKKVLLVTATPAYDKEGTYTGAFGIFRDITVMIRQEEHLQREKALSDLVLKTVPSAVFTVDLNTRITSWNNKAEEITGYSAAEILGKSCRIFTLDPCAKRCGIQEAKVPSKVCNRECTIKTKDGRVLIIKKNVDFITDEAGIIIEGIECFEDITEQKRIETELKERNELFDKIASSTQDAMVVIDDNGLVVLWNQGAEAIFGHTRSEVLGNNLHNLITPQEFLDDHRKGFAKFIVSGMGGALGKTLELPARHKTGKPITVELSLSGIKIKGRWHGVGIARDISKRKLQEQKLNEAIVKANEANEAKSRFLANMSHEIRTPMNAILGFSEILKNKIAEGDPSLGYIKGIYNSGKGLLTIINDILDLSKIESNKLEIQREATDLEVIIKELIHVFEIKAKSKGLYLKENYEKTLNNLLFIDGHRLRQVITNLLDNALKFTKRGGIELHVRFENTDNKCTDIIIEVADTGIGIPLADQQLIFEPFTQRDNQKTREFGGTGLGLAITKRLVSIMGGEIEIESAEGKGSVFRVKIPNVPICNKEMSGPESLPFEKTDFMESKVLIVEDMESNRMVIRGYLEDCNVKIFEAENGRKGLKIAYKQKPDLILMDIHMPEMNGFDAVKKLRENHHLLKVPVVALTASIVEDDMGEILANFTEYLSKPLSQNDLMKVLKKHLIHKDQKKEHDAHNSEMNIRDRLNSIKEISCSRGFISKITEEFVPKSRTLSSGTYMNEITEFANFLLTFSREERVPLVEEYARELLSDTQSFNIKGVKENLALLNVIANKLTSYE